MDIVNATVILNEARAAVESGRGLGGSGFWKLVHAVKADPDFGAPLIDEIAAIDNAAHRNWAMLVVPLWVGTTVMIVGTVVGLVLVGLAYPTQGLWSAVWLLVGTGVLLITTHGLGHLVVGASVGIRFTSWFIGTLGRPQPGVKTDYASYLRTSPISRAWMHAAGAIVTKVVPFLLIGAAAAADVPIWAIMVLIAIGLISIITDVLWSTKASDWKKFQREMAFAQES